MANLIKFRNEHLKDYKQRSEIKYVLNVLKHMTLGKN